MRLTAEQIHETVSKETGKFIAKLQERFESQEQEENPFLSTLGPLLISSKVMSSYRSRLGYWFETLAGKLADKAGFTVLEEYKKIKREPEPSMEMSGGKCDLVLKKSYPDGDHYFLFELKTTGSIKSSKEAQKEAGSLRMKYQAIVQKEKIDPQNCHSYFVVVYDKKKILSKPMREYFKKVKC